ncbi:CBS domain-containing protein [Paractinoplanes brasiliensis]|uniref:BON domain-containing protein n=1 Tax=Paractinoplanes brasiliensis TaxID=52695 RepID=A0A4R6JYE4_9ACTN|nr:CBS domain-containing protein [Actinoplanes brasiliensis]TDO41883.1 BON domain-containing protein [Actinoplanes brasiliensis]
MRTWTVDDVMTRAVVSAEPATTYRELVDLLAERRISAIPVIDELGRVLGVVSETDLLRKVEYAGGSEPRVFDGPRRRDDLRRSQGRTAAELMTTHPVVVPGGTSIMSAARTMDRAGVKRVPVVDVRGRLIGIVTRGDLLKVHLRSDGEILADVRINVVERFLPEEAETVLVNVVDGVVTLAGKVDRWSSADIAERLTRQIAGVVDMTSTLEYRFDDSQVHGSRLGFGTR